MDHGRIANFLFFAGVLCLFTALLWKVVPSLYAGIWLIDLGGPGHLTVGGVALIIGAILTDA